MNSNLPQKNSNKFIDKIKRFFVHIFNKKVETSTLEIQEKSIIQEKSMNEIEKMQEQSKKIHLQDDIVEIIDKNPELIDKLTTQQLRNLRKVYVNIIQKNESEILRLTNKLKSAMIEK